MSHYVLYVAQNEDDGQLPWPLDLSGRGIVVLTARSQAQAIAYCRAYPLMMILAEIETFDNGWREGFAKIRESVSAEIRPQFIGVVRGALSESDRADLASNGVDGLVSFSDPEDFVVGHIELLARLAELSRFEQTRMDVNQLAKSTREQLHDLSQPLSAIQGRLQLLAAMCPQDDPNCKNLNELVQLSFKVSGCLAEMQQFHRKYS
ncbi:hypothetical protein LLG95_07465 [bacterium]|nr:hypothetical protein [bacterium]